MVNPIVSQVAGGRRLSARTVVMTTLSSLICNVFAKVIDTADNQARFDYVYGDEVEVLSKGDEHAFSYEEKGFAYLLLDHFAGGDVYADESQINGLEETFYAQIEPFNPDLDGRDKLIQIPDWKIQNNDILAVFVDDDVTLYFEVVGIQGQAIQGDYATKYRLNKRDDFNHVEPMSL